MEFQAKFPDLTQDHAYTQDQELRATLTDGIYHFLYQEASAKDSEQRDKIRAEVETFPVVKELRSFEKEFREATREYGNSKNSLFDRARDRAGQKRQVIFNRAFEVAKTYDKEIHIDWASDPTDLIYAIREDYQSQVSKPINYPTRSIVKAKMALIPNFKKETFESLVEKCR